jgi:hypothetical protein
VQLLECRRLAEALCLADLEWKAEDPVHSGSNHPLFAVIEFDREVQIRAVHDKDVIASVVNGKVVGPFARMAWAEGFRLSEYGGQVESCENRLVLSSA